MCEIEHFVDPSNKKHPKFEMVSHEKLMLFSACNQLEEKGPEKVFDINWHSRLANWNNLDDYCKSGI